MSSLPARRWVVRPENATLTADCFDVLLRDMVALQQAAAVDGLSSGELGVQAQVRQGQTAAKGCRVKGGSKEESGTVKCWWVRPSSRAVSAAFPAPPPQVSARIEELLHTAFENYFMLSEETSSGMMDGALAVRSGIPAVLRPAVHLFSEWSGCRGQLSRVGEAVGSSTAHGLHQLKMVLAL